MRAKLRSPRWRAFAELCSEIGGLPRHISQHPGGMVISTRPLVEIVPVQPSAMAGRQMCQWDKDSCADAGFLKIDLLGLGMLSAVEECIDLIAHTRDELIDLSRIALDDKDVYAEIQNADTVGCFQIESRAQMQTILRTQAREPRRPDGAGRARAPGADPGQGRPPVHRAPAAAARGPVVRAAADHPLLQEPLRETLGVIVFQDQVLDVAIHLAGFTVGEAEGLRRAMSRKRSLAALEAYRDRFIAGALGKGVDEQRRPLGLRQARRVLRLRLPEVALRGVRAARVPVRVAAPPLQRRVPRGAAQRAADGLLSAGDARPRRAAARCRDASARRQPQRRRLHDRGRRSSRRPQVRAGRRGGRRDDRRRGTRSRTGRTSRSATSRSA